VDSYTLHVGSAMASAIMMVSLFLLYRASPRELCLLDWTAAGLLFLLRNCFGITAFFPDLQQFSAAAIVNTLYLAGHGALLVGVRRHLGLTPGWQALGWFLLLVFMLNLLPAVQNSVSVRLLLMFPLVLLFNVAVIWLLWRAPNQQMHSVYSPLIVIELVFSAQLIAKLVLVMMDPALPFTPHGTELLQTSGILVLLGFIMLTTMACALIVIRRQELELRRASDTDPLTGWLNRRALQRIANHEFARCDRTGQSCAMLTFDIDHFKKINDSYGHAIGDEALLHVTRLAQDVLRGYDYQFRIGGEEFVVLLSNVKPTELAVVAGRLRQKILLNPLVNAEYQIDLTISIGYAQRQGQENWQALLDRADRALYHAKQHGRDRVSFYNLHNELEWQR
jgi:diguanylate cyclase (GGDEF)-like protein